MIDKLFNDIMIHPFIYAIIFIAFGMFIQIHVSMVIRWWILRDIKKNDIILDSRIDDISDDIDDYIRNKD